MLTKTCSCGDIKKKKKKKIPELFFLAMMHTVTPMHLYVVSLPLLLMQNCNLVENMITVENLRHVT